jgi:predicted nucleotidyltransferase
MERRSIRAIAEALDRTQVRYLVVGGIAVVAHGHLRYTADLDLVLDPDPGALRRAIEALSALGYRPRAPIAFEGFADPAQRRAWAEQKGMMVFSLVSSEHAATELDLFLESPFDFEAVYSRSVRMTLRDGTAITVVALADLIELKRSAGRERDLQDIRELESLRDEEGRDA